MKKFKDVVRKDARTISRKSKSRGLERTLNSRKIRGGIARISRPKEPFEQCRSDASFDFTEKSFSRKLAKMAKKSAEIRASLAEYKFNTDVRIECVCDLITEFETRESPINDV